MSAPQVLGSSHFSKLLYLVCALQNPQNPKPRVEIFGDCVSDRNAYTGSIAINQGSTPLLAYKAGKKGGILLCLQRPVHHI